MSRFAKSCGALLCAVALVFCAAAAVFAKSFAPSVNATNVGVKTQYLYAENDRTWIRKLVIKEDMYSIEGLADAKDLFPVTDYPYRTDAPCFLAEVAQNVELFTLTEDSQRAAYLYVLDQLGAVTIISEPTTDGKTKADWLREQGIVVTAEDEADREKLVMISGLYALMKNDFYYVYKGEHLTIPEGTPLEEATVMYLVAMSGQDSRLGHFIQNNFGREDYGNLEDYVYYTSLMALYTGGYVRANEITSLSREDVNRRVAIMTINTGGIAVDADTATDEEITLKYLTAMLNRTYKVTMTPDAVKKAQANNSVAFLILQQMAYEDKRIAITPSKYTYEKAFETVLLRTDRFKLPDDFYSDIFEYNVYLDNTREAIYINPETIYTSADGESLRLFLGGTEYALGSYARYPLDTTKDVQTVTIKIMAPDGHASIYAVHVHQSAVAPSDSGNLTGLLPSVELSQGRLIIGDYEFTTVNPSFSLNADGNLVDAAGNIVETLASGVIGILHLNDKNQLVDANGNLISAEHYDPLPVGYQYVLDENGNINILMMPTETAATTAPAEETKGTDWQKLALPIGAGAVILALGVVLAVVLKRRHTDPQKAAEKMKARRLRQRKRRAKAMDRASRKDQYNNKRF